MKPLCPGVLVRYADFKRMDEVVVIIYEDISEEMVLRLIH